jgi:hypothetical protein
VIDDYLTGIVPLNNLGKQFDDRIDREGESKILNDSSSHSRNFSRE